MQNDVTESERVRAVQSNDHHANCDKPPQSAHPEPAPESLLSRQAVGTPWAAFDSTEHYSWGDCWPKVAAFLEHPCTKIAVAEVVGPSQIHCKLMDHEESYKIEHEHTHRPKPVWS